MTRGSRWRLAVCLLAVLLGGGWGCHPGGSTGSTGSAPSTTKPDRQPENKDQPAKPPKPSVG